MHSGNVSYLHPKDILDPLRRTVTSLNELMKQVDDQWQDVIWDAFPEVIELKELQKNAEKFTITFKVSKKILVINLRWKYCHYHAPMLMPSVYFHTTV